MPKEYVILFVLTFVAIVFANHEGAELIKNLERGFKEVQNSRVFPAYLNDTLEQLQIPRFFRREDPADMSYRSNDELEGSLTCSLCYVVVNFLIEEKRNNVSLDWIALEGEAVCILLKIENSEVCKGVIELNLPIFAYIVDANQDLKSERICDIILQNTGCNATTFEWTVDIPEGETVTRKDKSNPESTFNVLQISDYHFDPMYTPGKFKNCDLPVCCQSDQANGSVADGTACGYWSEYINADASEALVDEVIRKSNEFDFDYIYFTGDIVSHRVWATSVESNERDMKLIFKKMKAAFPGKPIYPILGNHEPTPLNQYQIGDDPDVTLATQWLYQLIASEFSEWLPESAQESIMKGGFYSVSPREGLRVVALNSNVGYTMNWWLIHNDTDPFSQLAWLAKTLKEAEDNNEVVHILSHIPGGKSDLLKVWSREYHKIIERFANTIGAQFNGHTHHDQFMIYHSTKNTSEAIGIAINGASVICDKSNPNFRIFNIDSSSFDIIDTQQYTFNLTEANLAPGVVPNWYQLYSFRESYGVSSLVPSEFSELLPRMATNHDLLYNYHIYRYRNSDIAVNSGCDDSCKKNYLCEIAVSQVGDSTQCDRLINLYDQHVL